MRLARLLAATALCALWAAGAHAQWEEEPLGEINRVDPFLKAWGDLTPENPPADLEPGVDYGMDAGNRHLQASDGDTPVRLGPKLPRVSWRSGTRTPMPIT